VRESARFDHPPDPNVCDAGYLLSVLTHPAAKGYIESFNSGGSRRAITKGHIESFDIPLPPLAEQKAIAAMLGSLDDKIELNRRMNATLEAMARALFQSWFVDFDPVRAKLDGRQPPGLDPATAALFPDSFAHSKVGIIPDKWEDTTIGEQVTLQRGIDITKKQQQPGVVPVISSGGVSSYHDTAHRIGPGVVLGRKGVVGSVYFVDEPYWPHDTTLWVRDFHGNHPYFVFYFFLSIAGDIARMDVGSANPTLNRNHVHQLPSGWPPKSIQAAFSEIAHSFHTQINRNRRETKTLSAIRDTLLPKLLSGELSVAEVKTSR
jgi:type I restriction enzyme, S subunit